MANTDKDIVITPNTGQAAAPTISFVGFDNVVCTLTVNPNGTLTVNRQFVSSVATGTAPFAVSSTTRVDNLNADLLDGFNTASASTVNTVVLRDASGDVNVRLVRSEFANQTTMSGAMAFRINNTTDNYVRFVSDTPAIRTFLDVPTRTGTNASGTWGINITGNAATATVLQTARTIGGVSFNGSANINLPGVNTAGNQNTSGNAATATLVTGTSGQLQRHDIRTIAPSAITAGRLQFGFTSLANNSSAPYADFLHLRSYTDASGGSDNLVMFNKSAIGMRIYQQAHGSATAYSSFKDIAFTDGTNTSGTWPISITGNAASITNQTNSATITASTAATANQIVLRDGSGDDFRRYGFAQYFNMSHGVSGATGDTVFYSSSDNYIRKNNATGFRASLNAVFARTQGNWLNSGVIDNVVGLLAWKNYSNGHVIFDASQSTSPSGTAVNNTNSQVAWSGTYPTLMGWNGVNTYGVRVDSARVADSATDATKLPLSGGTMTGTITNSANSLVIGTAGGVTRGYLYNDGAGFGLLTSGGGWALRVNYSGSTVQAESVLIANQDMRAPIFYDQNDTAFYVDPNNFSSIKQLRVAARTQTANYYDAAIEVREFNYGGTQADIFQNYPRIGFHWGGRVASSIAMSSNGWINIMNNPGTGWENIRANQGLFNNDVTAFFSDVRLKTRVGTIDNAIEKVKSIETFKYVNNQLANSFGFVDELVHVGVSAQSVEAVLPEVVKHAPFDIKVQDGITVSASGEWYKTVQYEKLVPLLIEAIKEQQAQIDKLENHVAQLLNNK